MSQPAIELNSLVKNYGTTQAVKGISFQVQPGEIFGLLGPNGAGKTSIISILTTLEKPTAGTASVFGWDVTSGKAKSYLGVVPQELVSHGFFTVREVLEFHSGYYGYANNKDRINYLLDRLGLKGHSDKRVRQLSGGMKRRLLIAKALVHRPRLLLLDEPTAGVDVELRTSLWEFVRELHKEGVAILLTTHYLEEAESLCQRVGIIHLGNLLKVSNTHELVSELTFRQVSIFLTRKVEKISSPHLKSQTDKELTFRLPSRVALGSLLSTIPSDSIRDIQVREGKLEEAFLSLVENKNGTP